MLEPCCVSLGGASPACVWCGGVRRVRVWGGVLSRFCGGGFGCFSFFPGGGGASPLRFCALSPGFVAWFLRLRLWAVAVSGLVPLPGCLFAAVVSCCLCRRPRFWLSVCLWPVSFPFFFYVTVSSRLCQGVLSPFFSSAGRARMYRSLRLRCVRRGVSGVELNFVYRS